MEGAAEVRRLLGRLPLAEDGAEAAAEDQLPLGVPHLEAVGADRFRSDVAGRVAGPRQRLDHYAVEAQQLAAETAGVKEVDAQRAGRLVGGARRTGGGQR